MFNTFLKLKYITVLIPMVHQSNSVICVCVCIHIYIYVLFKIFFSIMVYHGILNTVPCAAQ